MNWNSRTYIICSKVLRPTFQRISLLVYIVKTALNRTFPLVI